MGRLRGPEKRLERQWSWKRLIVPVGCVVTLALLGVIAGAMRVAVRQPYSGFGWSPTSGAVYAVAPGSPAATAGLHPGDVILAIDGRPGAGAVAIYAARAAGETVAMSVLWDGQYRMVPLGSIPPPPSELLRRLMPLLVALCFALFSFSVWAHNPYDQVVILFLGFNQLGAAVLALGLPSSLYLSWPHPWFALSLTCLSAMLIHFHLIFPRPRLSIRRRWVIPGLYGLVVVSFPFYWFGLRQPVDTRWYVLTRSGARFSFVTAVLVVAVLLLHTYVTTSSSADRRRIRLVVFGTLLAFVPLVGLALLPEVLIGAPFVAYEFTFPFLLLIPLAYTIAIHRHDLLPIDRLVNRGVVHLALLLILGLVYLGLALGLPRLGRTSWVEQPLTWGLVTLLVALLFAPLRSWLGRLVDRLFYSGWYDYRSVVSEMSRALGGIVGAKELAELLVGRLAPTLRLHGAALLLLTDGELLALAESTGRSFDEIPGLPLSRTGALARALCQAARPLTPPELRAALAEAPLTDVERSWLSHPDLALWVPLVRQGKLQGLLLLGPRAGEDPFDTEDRRLLGTLAWNAAIVAENARLFEALRHHAEEVNRLYTQLAQSREEERKRLARELHDQVIQDLINVYHYLDVDGPRLAPTPREHAQALQAWVQLLVERLRQVCTALRPAALDGLDLGLAVDGYVEEVTEEWGLPITLRLPQNRHAVLAPLPEDIRVCLFRALQEALTNVRHHAQATRVQVQLAVESGYVTLEVRDDGRGFQCPARLGTLIREGHFGLAGLQERLNMVGGTLEVESAPGRGATLRARVPWDGGANAEQDGPKWADLHPPSSHEFLRAP